MIQRAATTTKVHLDLILSPRFRKLIYGKGLSYFLKLLLCCGPNTFVKYNTNGLGCCSSMKCSTCLDSIFVLISLHIGSKQFANWHRSINNPEEHWFRRH